jgi:tRNA dimethylallyltransferase
VTDTGSVIALLGPTAVGKTAVSLVIGRQVPAEIIAVDSMQVYRGLDIGTAKPTPAERQAIPHHLIDVVELRSQFSVFDFVRLAGKAMGEIHARRRVAILCGGTGLYFTALQKGLAATPASQPDLRAELEAQPLAVLLEELRRADLQTYQRIDRRNPRRVIRAVERLRLTDRLARPEPTWRSTGTRNCRARVFILDREDVDLRERIDRRVRGMMEAGLVEETRKLLNEGLAENRTAMQAIGYRQVVEYFEGRRSLAETITMIRQRTWQLARRQRTWFRHHTEGTRIVIGRDEAAEKVAERLRREFETEPGGAVVDTVRSEGAEAEL